MNKVCFPIPYSPFPTTFFKLDGTQLWDASRVSIAKYNLFSPEFFANPYSVLNQMQEEDPVYLFEPQNWWFVMRYSDVLTILQDTVHFSASRPEKVASFQTSDGAWSLLEDYVQRVAEFCFFSDAPQYTYLRKIVEQAFLSTIVFKASAIQNIVNELLNNIQEKGEMDGCIDFSEPLVCFAIANILGIPKADWQIFREWAVETAKLFDGRQLTIKQAKYSQKCSFDLRAYLIEEIKKRYQNPQEDAISLIISEKNLGKNCLETVATFCLEMILQSIIDPVANGIFTLLNHPNQLEKLKEKPLLWFNAVEEILRYQSPTIFTHRLVKEDIQIRGREFKKGQIVFLGLGCANRDRTIFQQPDCFDITRKDIKYFSFVHGIHQRVGATLACLEMRIALQTLFERFPKLQIAGNILWKQESLIFHSPRSLPLAF
ncbi:MAG: cytochrome P450 [Nostoc sp. DedQUE12a]|nr:cytochrome P450 [Nostoc sp. DedQUE12a]